MIVTDASENLKLVTCIALTQQTDSDEPAKLYLQSVCDYVCSDTFVCVQAA